MSMGGSLMGYENNNDVCGGGGVVSGGGNGGIGHHSKAAKKSLKPLPVATSVNAAGITTAIAGNGGLAGSRASRNYKPIEPRRPASRTRTKRRHLHVNSLWSVWYGVIAVAFQIYIAVRSTKRFIAFLSLPWPADAPPPKAELHACLALLGAGLLLLPILLAAAFLKLGNLANDGIKLGRSLSTCSRDPPSSVLNGYTDSGLGQNLWRHGGPISAFIHLCTAMCFLLPSLFMEARLIHAGFLPKGISQEIVNFYLATMNKLEPLELTQIPQLFHDPNPKLCCFTNKSSSFNRAFKIIC
ncbi:hypothetical protein QAD02_006106 [Eretmocerus hayati]|uniref:Uncharacterized protein n=1 Tax=Eretmocerus hayati TaxID=131215 RepID=A0ACC2N2B7_9HYME|nr:hypothetical protein QAD02_006106 [Eretmocerus hayati]